MNITYRLATAEDTELLVHYRIVLLDAVTPVNHTDEERDMLRDTLRTYFPKAINDSSYFAWLAWDGDTCAGVSGMVVYERPASYNCPTGYVGYILNMYTEPGYRRLGICSALVGKLLLKAKERNVSALALHASKEGERVYRKSGFTDPATLVLEKRF